MTQSSNPTTMWTAQAHLPVGTYEYKYRVRANGRTSWENIPHVCAIQGGDGINRRAVTVVSSNAGLGGGKFGQGGVTAHDRWSHCHAVESHTNKCETAQPQLDVTFLGEVVDRTLRHKIKLVGDAHAEQDGVHFDGDGDFVSIPNFDYYDGQRWTFSMWVTSDVCDPHDKTPSVYGYIYSHTQKIGKGPPALVVRM